MSQPSLKKLTIDYLRGSVTPFALPFEKGRKLTIVYGENASGKSTICDAFEFLGNGKVGSLENRGLGKTNKYWHSLGRDPADVIVTLETANSTCLAKIVKSEVVVDPAAARPRVEVLRRSQILSLIEATPADRYAEVSRFIDVSGVEASEATLRGLIRDMDGSRGIAIARIQENQDAIGQFWSSAGEPGTDALSWAETEATRDPNESDVELEALAKLQAAYVRLGDYPTRLKAAEAAIKAAASAAIVVQAKIDEQLQTIAKDAGEIVGLLEAARSYLQKHTDPQVCPLCESAEKVDGLSQRITQRLGSFSALQATRVQVTAAGRNTQQVEQQLAVLRDSAKKHAEEFEQARTGFVWSSDIVMPLASAPVDIAALADWLAATAPLVVDWKKVETARIDKKQFTRTLKGALKTYLENVATQQELDILLPNLTRTLGIVQEERRSFTDSVLAKIAGEVGRLYEEVHPNEGLNKIGLELDPSKRASLSIGASFCGQAGAQPQAYFSDSHLDTLGLCVFLALAAMDGAENTILVLDDVLASVDEPHVERVIGMIYEVSKNFRHTIVTTHYLRWREKFRWGEWKPDQVCQFVELKQWTLGEGITLTGSIPEIVRLKALLADSNPDVQSACSKAGVILEAMLNFLTLRYGCAVTRRVGDAYVLSDLLGAVNGKLLAALKVETVEHSVCDSPVVTATELKSILDEIAKIAQARNVMGAHFNAVAFDLYPVDGLKFARLVEQLCDALICPEHGWPNKDKSGSYWNNGGDTRRLHPLKKPA
ncbi:hypothetical protein [Thermomonas sp.]|uniref:hypothetical protein n=1 Tax=Thermomonas sp. TaxID=1971895 RepID=UPI002488EABC|nr:hypothetical protein [Thermomonas sp.]MDI1252411.1 hypothetical protein [Thermomonas sp.]